MDYPKSVPSVGLVNGRFVDENTATGQPGSLIPAAWGNAVTDEVLGVLKEAGLKPDELNQAQLVAAILVLIDWNRLRNKPTSLGGIGVPFATQLEAEQGTDTAKPMNALRVAQAIAVRVATQFEVNEGLDAVKTVSPKTLTTLLTTRLQNLWVAAKETSYGVVQLATKPEVIAGTESGKVVTPRTLMDMFSEWWKQATTTTFGVTKIASQNDVDAGTDPHKTVTPITLSTRLGNLWKTASESIFGVVKLATRDEVLGGTDPASVVTSYTLAVKIASFWKAATEQSFGYARIATIAESQAGTGDSTIITPRKMQYGISWVFARRGHFAFPTWAGGLIINWGLETGIQQATTVAAAVGPVRDATLSLAFPTQGFGVLASMGFATMATTAAFAPGATLLSNSVVRLQNNYTASSGDIFWIAFGN